MKTHSRALQPENHSVLLLPPDHLQVNTHTTAPLHVNWQWLTTYVNFLHSHIISF